MSGVFETAAGAFAVVGVADVLVRTGRELYSFLRDVADAPEGIKHLRDSIQETLVLYQTSKQCQDNLKARSTSATTSSAIPSLETANKSLNRELQSLKLLVSKFKGTKTWSRVKYVLSEAKVTKAIANLEHAKALLASALTLACREFAALGDEQIESVVRQGFSQAGLQVDDLSKALTAKLDTQHQETLAAHTDQQRVLTSKFDAQESMHIANHDKQQRAIADLHCSQTTMVSRQDTSICIAKRTQKQTTAIIRTLHRADTRATENSKKTMANLDDIAADMKQLLSMHGAAGQRPQSDREISFLGEHADKIMQYLLPFEDELDDAIDSLISMGGKDISTSHAEWLRLEMHRMIDSAAQEKALQHPSSTATSIDEWSYAEDTVGFLKDRPRKRKATWPIFPTFPTGRDVSEPTERPRKKQKRLTQEWKVPTSCGDLHITLPRAQTKNRGREDVEEVALSYTTVLGRSTVKVQARFWRELCYASRPRIHAQLNAFVQVDINVESIYGRLFEDGSLAEIDEALRTGTISPFHLNQTDTNLCLFYAMFHVRKDILEYLDTQGIGQRALNRDADIWGCWLIIVQIIRENDVQGFYRKLLNGSADPVTLSLQMSLALLLHPNVAMGTKPSWRDLFPLLRTLRDEHFDPTQNELLAECCSLKEPRLFEDSIPQLLLLLISAGTSVMEKDLAGRNMITMFFYNFAGYRYERQVSVDFISILIENGVDVNDVDERDLTVSMAARYLSQWNVWCDALKQSNRTIEDVVHAEGTTWLLGSDWHEVWVERRYCDWMWVQDLRKAGRYTDGFDNKSDCGEDSLVETEDEETDDEDDDNEAQERPNHHKEGTANRASSAPHSLAQPDL